MIANASLHALLRQLRQVMLLREADDLSGVSGRGMHVGAMRHVGCQERRIDDWTTAVAH